MSWVRHHARICMHTMLCLNAVCLCSSDTEWRGEREERAADQGLERAEDSHPQPRSVMNHWTVNDVLCGVNDVLCGVC